MKNTEEVRLHNQPVSTEELRITHIHDVRSKAAKARWEREKAQGKSRSEWNGHRWKPERWFRRGGKLWCALPLWPQDSPAVRRLLVDVEFNRARANSAAELTSLSNPHTPPKQEKAKP